MLQVATLDVSVGDIDVMTVDASLPEQGKSLTIDDYKDMAHRLGCKTSALMAVGEVEAPFGGFLFDGRVRILFERHVFSKLTQHKYDSIASDVSSQTPGGYKGGAAEWLRLERAAGLNISDNNLANIASESCSWGKFQLMGYNYDLVDCPDINNFITTMMSGEQGQLGLFGRFIRSTGLAKELQEQNWAKFALRYNGPRYQMNHYDSKLKFAEAKFAALGVHN